MRTTADIKELRQRIANREKPALIAQEWGISRQRIYQIMQQHGIEPNRQFKKKRKFNNPREYAVWNLWRTKRYHCKKENIVFTLVYEDLLPIPEKCPILGIKFDAYDSLGKVINLDQDLMSIDRIDNTLGYIPGNVQLISWRANCLKGNMTFEEIEKLYKYMKNNLDK